MLKALFLDLDETLCDTTGANNKALAVLGNRVEEVFQGQVDKHSFTAKYLKGIYRELDLRYQQLLLPIVDEGEFRLKLITLILKDLGIDNTPADIALHLQQTFDDSRTASFAFYPEVKDHLLAWRPHYTLVVITNGPEFSQLGKVAAVSLQHYVDHIIIGGQEPEQKPAKSIFEKALRLANCLPEDVLHIGDSLTADIAGANNANIRSAWVSHGQLLSSQPAAIPDYIINHPHEINDLLQRLK
jgi:HAD superfamily hydrolase (TIGR01549 family)